MNARLAALDKDVLRLAQAGYLDREILELLDCRVEELQAALERLAEWLAPTASSRQSIDLWDCLPLREGLCGAA